MGYFKAMASMYAEAYCVINSLDKSNPDDWEKAMQWVQSTPINEIKKYIKEQY